MSKTKNSSINNHLSSTIQSGLESCSNSCDNCHCHDKQKKSATNNQWTSTNL